MPITLTTAGVPWARYEARTGRLAFDGEGAPSETNFAGLQLAVDPENSVPGWLRVADSVRDFVRATHNQPPPKSPSTAHVWTFAMLIYCPRVLGDRAYEICDSSLTVGE